MSSNFLVTVNREAKCLGFMSLGLHTIIAKFIPRGGLALGSLRYGDYGLRTTAGRANTAAKRTAHEHKI